MPDSAKTVAERHEEAVRKVEEWLEAKLRTQLRLSDEDIARYSARRIIRGWRITVEVSNGTQQLDIIITEAFPYMPPRIALASPPSFLTWAHVERDGVLCLTPDHVTFSPDAPVAVIGALLQRACDLLSRIANGGTSEEFKSEIVSYWSQDANLEHRRVLSLIVGGWTQSRVVKCWKGKDSIIVANDDHSIARWVQNRFSMTQSIKTSIGALIHLNESLTPDRFPRAGSDVYRLADSVGCAHLLDQAAARDPQEVVAIFSLPADDGHAMVATVVERPKRRRGAGITNGFRKGVGAISSVMGARYFGSLPCLRAPVERVDAAWIHGRDRDGRITELQKAKVAVFGCGSVGAPVATMLAEAGVGHLILVDKDTLAAANVGRHPLGIDALGRHKSEALALLLRKCYPHLCIDYTVSSVETLMLSNSKQIEGVDLIVSALGSWPAEALLDQWHSSNAAPPAIVYGWTEPHAAAGHAVVLKGDGARLQDGLDETGTPLLQVTKWSEDMNLRAEPACGAFFQPYGPIEVGYINNMVGELCLDALLGRAKDATHRIWTGRDSLLADGGQWTERWISIMKREGVGLGGIFERRWAAETLRAD